MLFARPVVFLLLLLVLVSYCTFFTAISRECPCPISDVRPKDNSCLLAFGIFRTRTLPTRIIMSTFSEELLRGACLAHNLNGTGDAPTLHA